MAYADKEKKRALQREWCRKKRESNPDWHTLDKTRKKERNHRVRSSGEGNEEREKRNEKNWRFREWEHAHRTQYEREVRKELRVTAMHRFKNPIFIFNYKGFKYREQLFEPLPMW